MSSVQFIYAHAQEEITLRHGSRLVTELYRCVNAACATYENLTFILRVKVNQHLAVHHAGLKMCGTGQSGLLGHREQALHRAMLNLTAVQNRKSHCYAHTIIGSKGGTAGLQPAVLHVCLNGLGHEIMVQGGVLLAYHILMRLQYYRLTALIARSCRLAYKHIAHIILACSQSAGCGKIHQVLSHFLLTARRTRNPAYLQEYVHHSL